MALADGLGGHHDGALAAKVAVRAALAQFTRTSLADPAAAVSKAGAAAAAAVTAQRRRRGSDMATTLCLLLVTGDSAAWIHAGDSRIYRLGPGAVCERLTIDHTAAMAALAEPERRTADLRDAPARNRLVSVLGPSDPLFDVAHEQLVPGASYALCSDGFWETAPDTALFGTGANPHQAARLLDLAIARQGPDGDNATLVLVQTQENKR